MNLPISERIAVSICVLAILGSSLQYIAQLQANGRLRDQQAVSRQADLNSLQHVIDSTVAKSVLVYDLKNNTLVSGKAMEAHMSLASITKIFTSALAYETFLQTHDRDSKEARAFLERIQLMLTQSSNEEAESIGLIFGNTPERAVANLNLYTKQYKLTFKNLSGLDLKQTGEVGGQGVTTDLARGIRDVYFKYPEIFDKTILPYDDNTNQIAGKLDFFLAGKTGYTEYSGGNLAVIIQKGITHKYLIIVLGSTENDRFVDVEHIVKALLQLNV